MVSVRAASAAGKKYETDLMKHFRDDYSLDVERLRMTGAEDEGDLLLRLPRVYVPRLVVEAKRRREMNLGGWLKEAEEERNHYAAHRGIERADVGFVVVHYRRQHNISQSYVTTSLEEYLRQIGAV